MIAQAALKRENSAAARISARIFPEPGDLATSRYTVARQFGERARHHRRSRSSSRMCGRARACSKEAAE